MAGKKRENPERLFVFELKLWGVTARVAERFADAARRLLVNRHPLSVAWESAIADILGWDCGRGWKSRAKKGGDVISVISVPCTETSPVPETALLSGEADDRPPESERD